MVVTVNRSTEAPTGPDKQSSPAVKQKARRSPRRRLSEEQKAEIARLYSETTTTIPEIRQQFGIADSGLYRLIQQRGVALRGRVTGSARAEAPPAGKPTDRNGDVGRRPAPVRSTSTVASRRVTPKLAAANGAAGTYRVSFAALRTITAVDMLDALRQADLFGATEIMEIVRSQ